MWARAASGCVAEKGSSFCHLLIARISIGSTAELQILTVFDVGLLVLVSVAYDVPDTRVVGMSEMVVMV
jgi:hypothetical protein